MNRFSKTQIYLHWITLLFVAITYAAMELRGWFPKGSSSGDANIMDAPEMQPHEGAAGTLEQHLQRVIGHLNTMHTISSMAWRQRPHHGIWLSRKLRDSKA